MENENWIIEISLAGVTGNLKGVCWFAHRFYSIEVYKRVPVNEWQYVMTLNIPESDLDKLANLRASKFKGNNEADK